MRSLGSMVVLVSSGTIGIKVSCGPYNAALVLMSIDIIGRGVFACRLNRRRDVGVVLPLCKVAKVTP